MQSLFKCLAQPSAIWLLHEFDVQRKSIFILSLAVIAFSAVVPLSVISAEAGIHSRLIIQQTTPCSNLLSLTVLLLKVLCLILALLALGETKSAGIRS